MSLSKRLCAAATLVVVMGLFAVGCGGGGSSTSSGGSTGATASQETGGETENGGETETASSGGGEFSAEQTALLPPEPENAGEADVAEAQERLLTAIDNFRFEPRSEPIEASKVKKTTWVLACGEGNLYCKNVAAGVMEAAKVAGVPAKTYVIDEASHAAAAVETAVNGGAGAIILIGLDPKSVQAPLEEAQGKGVKVVGEVNQSKGEPLVPGTEAEMTVDFGELGKINADYAVAMLGEDTNAFCGQTKVFPTTVNVCEGFTEELAELCPDCKSDTGDFNLTALSREVPAGIQAEVQSNPELSFVMCSFDAFCQLAVPTIQSLGKKGEIWAGSQTGQVVPNLQWVKEGNVQMIDVGNPQHLNGWASLDQALRLQLGQEPAAEGGEVPVKTFTHETLKDSGVDLSSSSIATEEEAYETEGGALYKTKYEELWGVK
jgi:ribose transport system substrate-binding protein